MIIDINMKKTPFEKLKELCNIVNKRYAKGLNDDDQVKKMFDYKNKHPELDIIVGYDTYKAKFNFIVEVGQLYKEPHENIIYRIHKVTDKIIQITYAGELVEYTLNEFKTEIYPTLKLCEVQ